MNEAQQIIAGMFVIAIAFEPGGACVRVEIPEAIVETVARLQQPSVVATNEITKFLALLIFVFDSEFVTRLPPSKVVRHNCRNDGGNQRSPKQIRLARKKVVHGFYLQCRRTTLALTLRTFQRQATSARTKLSTLACPDPTTLPPPRAPAATFKRLYRTR